MAGSLTAHHPGLRKAQKAAQAAARRRARERARDERAYRVWIKEDARLWEAYQRADDEDRARARMAWVRNLRKLKVPE